MSWLVKFDFVKDSFSRVNNFLPLLLIIASVFSINLPIAFGSTFLTLFVATWFLSGKYKSKINIIKENPGALIALVLWGLYGLGILYSSASLHDSFHFFMKYAKLLIVPLIVSVLTTDKYRGYAINAFLISLILYLFVSYLNWFGVLSLGIMRHGTYMAVGAYLMFRNANRASGQYRYTWIFLSVLTVFNIIFICDVRTGVITLLCLSIIFTLEIWGRKALLLWVSSFILGFLLIHFVPGIKQLNPRLANSVHEVASHQAQNHPTSAGTRLEMYENTIKLIKRHPFIGGGTGSLQVEYYELIKHTDTVLTRVTNPHNQYLATMQDLGAVGLIVLFLFWRVHWRSSYSLSKNEHGHALRALIIATMVGSLFNSLLLDSGDGRMYCLLAGVLLGGFKVNSAENK